MSTVNPTLDEFFTYTEQAFCFLHDEYGFVKKPSVAAPNANPFSLRYENATTAVTVEGISWGSAAIVCVGRKDGKTGNYFELVPLWTLARLEGAGNENVLAVPSQSAQIEASAAALTRLATAALLGDFSAIDAARAYLEAGVHKASKS